MSIHKYEKRVFFYLFVLTSTRNESIIILQVREMSTNGGELNEYRGL